MKQTWKQRLTAARAMQGMTKTAFSKAVGVSPPTVTDWEKPVEDGGIAEMKGNNLTAACAALGVSATWLLHGVEPEPAFDTDATERPRPRRSGDGKYIRGSAHISKRTHAKQEKPGALPASSNELVVIPQFTGHGAAASLVLNDQPGQIHSWHVSPDWVAQNLKAHTGLHNLCIVTGFGDSMRPLYNPGDPLIMDKGVTSVDFDGLYFFRIGEEGFLKRLQRIPGKGLVAISQNKEYRDWVVKADMDFEVLGRIVKVWCGVDF